MGDRHRRPLGYAHNVYLRVELLSQRVDDAGAKPGFWLRKDADRCADPVVDYRKLLIRSSDIEVDGDLAVNFFRWESVLERVEDEFGDDQTETDGLTRRNAACIAGHFQCPRGVIATH